jgi:lauroyl/myristoyl acyltransferase
MKKTGRNAGAAPLPTGSLWRLRWRFRIAIVRGWFDSCNPRRQPVRAVVARNLDPQSAPQVERRFLEYRRRSTLVSRWLRQGIPHAERVVRVEGLDHLEGALSDGAGAILASGHFGHGRLIKPVLGLHGHRPLLVGGPNPRWPQIASRDLPAGLNLRPHLAALRDNRPVIMVLDGRRALSLTRIEVGGIGIRFASGAMQIARVSGAAILPAFVVDEGTLRDPLAIRLVLHEPLALQSTGDASADLLENLRRFAAVYAEELSRNPHNLRWDAVSESGEYERPPMQHQAGSEGRNTIQHGE